MAEPILRGEWLSPTGVILTFDYDAAGDFEIWWKDSTPQAQEYRKLGTTSEDTFEVHDLNWSTTYYFKVRAVLGTTYTAFSNEITLFCACGDVFIEGAPPPQPGPPALITNNYWQQSADPEVGNIAFMAKDVPHSFINLYERPDAIWYYQGSAIYPGTFFPAAIRLANGKVAIFDGSEFSGFFGWYWFSFHDGVIPENWLMRSARLGPDPAVDFRSREPTYRSIPYSMEYDGQNRVVVLQHWINWDLSPYYEYLTIQVSEDQGNTWGDEDLIAISTDGDEQFQATMAVDGNGDYWITMTEWTYPEGPQWWHLYPGGPGQIYVVYRVYKYVVGSGATLVREIVSKLTNEWGPPPEYIQLTWDVFCKSAVIAAEGSKIAIAFVDDFNQVGGTYPEFYGIPSIKVAISTDYGASWDVREVNVPGEDIFWLMSWATLLPTITISNGNLIMYLLTGATDVDGYRIIKSTNNGANWSLVYSFDPGDDFIFPWVFQLRSDGDYVILTGCKAAQGVETSLALWESQDGGDTWAGVNIVPVDPSIVLTAGA